MSNAVPAMTATPFHPRKFFLGASDPPATPEPLSFPIDAPLPDIFPIDAKTLQNQAHAFGLHTYGTPMSAEILETFSREKMGGLSKSQEERDFQKMFGVPLDTIQGNRPLLQKNFLGVDEESNATPATIGAPITETPRASGEEDPCTQTSTSTTRTTTTSKTQETRETSKKRKSSTSTTTVVTTTTTLPDGVQHVVSHHHEASSTANSSSGKGGANKKKNPKRRRRLSAADRKKNREAKMKALQRALAVLEAIEEQEDECLEEYPEDFGNSGDEDDEGLHTSLQLGEEESEIEMLEEKMTEMIKLNEMMIQEEDSISALRASREEMAQEYVQLSEDRRAAKIRYDEMQEELKKVRMQVEESLQAWSDIAHRRKNKKTRMIKVDEEIDQRKKDLDAIRASKRDLLQQHKDSGRDLLERLVSPLIGKLHQSAADREIQAAEEARAKENSPPVEKGIYQSGPFSSSSSSSGATSDSSSGSSSSDSSSSDSSSCSEYEASEDSDEEVEDRRRGGIASKSLYGATGSKKPISMGDLSARDVEALLMGRDDKLMASLVSQMPEYDEKPEMTGVCLNNSTCIHCGKFDKSFWDGKDQFGFICPDCVCGKCGKNRVECRHDAFWTEDALTTSVGKYVKRGVLPGKKIRRWTRTVRGVNVDETLVDKYERMRCAPIDEDYSGREGIENEYKRWLRRYIIHTFSVENLCSYVHNIYEMNVYVDKHKKDNFLCKPIRCIMCNSCFVYNNDERLAGSRSTTGNGTSRSCCTGCKNFFSKTYQKTFTWCKEGAELFERKKEARRNFLRRGDIL
jgi:hypothetical protein